MSRKVWMGVAILVVVLAIYVWLSAGPGHSINQEGFNRIENGMTQNEVEEVLGKPPGYYARDVVGVDASYISSAAVELEVVQWVSDEGAVIVHFHEGRVVKREYQEFVHPTFVDRLRWRLGL